MSNVARALAKARHVSKIGFERRIPDKKAVFAGAMCAFGGSRLHHTVSELFTAAGFRTVYYARGQSTRSRLVAVGEDLGREWLIELVVFEFLGMDQMRTTLAGWFVVGIAVLFGSLFYEDQTRMKEPLVDAMGLVSEQPAPADYSLAVFGRSALYQRFK